MKNEKLNYKGVTVDLSTPLVMGILNVNPNSFFDGGKYSNIDAIRMRCEQMIADGADIIDVGGASTKPGSKLVSVEEELNNVIPALEVLKKYFPDQMVSIDTYNAKTAEEAIRHGVGIVNDISAGNIDDRMFDVVGKCNPIYVLMHMQGTPENMQDQPQYQDLKSEVFGFLKDKVTLLKEKGVEDIVIDLGFGFGKTVEQNYQLLKTSQEYLELGLPILAGLSRKSFIQKVLDCNADEALNGTSVLNTLALQNGASILRVHDVKEAKETIKLLNYYTTV